MGAICAKRDVSVSLRDSETRKSSLSDLPSNTKGAYNGSDERSQVVLDDVPAQSTRSARHQSTELAARYRRVVCGELGTSFAAKPKVVRIFTSSTFTDTEVERNALMIKVIPKLKMFCQEKGYEFQVVDMRWGVREQSADDHTTLDLCLKELKACQQISTGPNFVTFLGQKYGFRPFPPCIPGEEFDQLTAAIEDEDERRLIFDWFKCDYNSVPPTHVLQPISTRIPDYLSHDRVTREKAWLEWQHVFYQLQQILRNAASKALKEKEQVHKYFMSVTESEIRQGVLLSPSPTNECCWFSRNITDLQDHVTDDHAHLYIDVDEDKEIDVEAQRMLGDFKQDLYTRHLPKENIRTYDVPWRSGGLDPNETADHKAYIETMCTDVQGLLERLITSAIDRRGSTEVTDQMYEEGLQHLAFCQSKCEKFFGREDLLETCKEILTFTKETHSNSGILSPSFVRLNNEINTNGGLLEEQQNLNKNKSPKTTRTQSGKCKVHPHDEHYAVDQPEPAISSSGNSEKDMRTCSLLENSLNKPLVIHGESGCGKTSVVSMVASKSRDWLGGNINIIIRYIGTTPDSSLIRLLLRSVCRQICAIYDEDSAFIRNDIKELREDFVRCLRMASAERPLLLVLDSLDQLGAEDSARQLSWLPMTLPDHVQLVVSTIPDQQYECFPVLKAFLPTECFVQVSKLPQKDAANIVIKYLSMENRTLSADQYLIVQQALEECSLPIFVRVAFDEAIKWKSYSPRNETVLEHTVRGAINALFERVERQHGHVLVSRALGYVTAAKDGLTENELEDLLSCDDHVLDDVYQYWTPPVRRIPPLLWVRIRKDLESYLVTRGADGARVITWYHRQFIEAAHDRYLKDEQETMKLHSNLSEYFLERWANGTKKPHTTPMGDRSSADRLVAPQPLVYESTTGKPTYNFRKLNELPYHLVCARQLDILKGEVLCNFEFLMTNLEASSLRDVLDDYDFALQYWPDDVDITLVKETLQLSAYALSQYPAELPSQLLGRIQNTESPYLKSLLQQATHCSRASLVPNTCCLTSPGGPMVHAMTGQTKPSTALALSNDGKLVASASADTSVSLWEVSTGRLVRTFENAGDDILSVVITNENTLLITSCPGCVSSWRVSTGQRLFRIEGHDACAPVSTITLGNTSFLVSIISPHVKLINLETGAIHRQFNDESLTDNSQLSSQVSMGITGSRLLYTGASSTERNCGGMVRSLDLTTGEFTNALCLGTDGESMQEIVGVTAYGTLLLSKGHRLGRRGSSAGHVILELWSLETKSRMRRLCNHGDRVRCFALSNDKTTVIFLSGIGFLDSANIFQGIVTVVNLSIGDSRESILRYPSNINSIVYIDETHFITSSNDKLLRLWDLHRNPKYSSQEVELDELEILSSRGSLVTFYGVDMVGVMNVWTGSVLRFTHGKAPQIQILDDHHLVVSNDSDLFLYDLTERMLVLQFNGSTRCDWLKSFFVFNQTSLVALATDRKSMDIYDVTSAERAAQLKADENLQIVGFSNSSNGRYCVTAHCIISEPEVFYGYVVWDVQQRKPTKTIRNEALERCTEFQDLQVSNDGHYVLDIAFDESSHRYRARVYDVTSGKIVHHPEPEAHTHEAAFTTDSGCFLLGLKDGRLQMYDLVSGVLSHSVRAHNGAVHRIFTSDLNDVVMTTAGGLDSKDRSVRLWKVSGQQISLLSVFTPDAKVSSMSFINGGRGVAMEITDIVPFLLVNQDGKGSGMIDVREGNDDVILGSHTVDLSMFCKR